MAECVDREAMLREIERRERFMVGDKTISVDALKRFIENRPTVDAVVVTRCKDCVHWDEDPDTYGADDGPKGKCMKSFETMCADDFCSYGEPKEG